MPPEPTLIPGCTVTHLLHHEDARGEFVKVFQAGATRAIGQDATIAELFWSRSATGVVRGLHFQLPPHAHAKVVTIIAGTAFDVVVDLRVGSPTFGQPSIIAMDASAPVAIYVPIGCAHGFQATAADTTIAYATTTEHAPEFDCGIRWDTVGVTWPIADAVLSDRDASFPSLAEFTSPFVYDESP